MLYTVAHTRCATPFALSQAGCELIPVDTSEVPGFVTNTSKLAHIASKIRNLSSFQLCMAQCYPTTAGVRAGGLYQKWHYNTGSNARGIAQPQLSWHMCCTFNGAQWLHPSCPHQAGS